MRAHHSAATRREIEQTGYRLVLKWIAVLAALLLAVPGQAQTIIAHRGASGERPEHTLASYDLAISEGADFVEPDLVFTKDGVLVARHENEISGTTDVADHPEFADRRATKVIDGQQVTGWFTEDFTLAELRTLRARERLPELRVANTRFDGLFQVPTLAEVIALVKAREAETGRTIGIYPEMKHPSYFAGLGFDMPARLVEQLAEAGYQGPDAPVFIQCFEVRPLLAARRITDLPLVQLMSSEGGPPELVDVSYAEMATPAGLKAIAVYADGIGPDIGMVLKPDGTPTALVADAHAAGLLVHPWTLRRENAFLPPALRKGDDPAAPGDYAALAKLVVGAGVDGFFTDFPGMAVALFPRTD